MATSKKVAPVLPAVQKAVLKDLKVTSTKIRYLFYCGYSNGDVARILNILPQFASNIHGKTVKDPIEDYPRKK